MFQLSFRALCVLYLIYHLLPHLFFIIIIISTYFFNTKKQAEPTKVQVGSTCSLTYFRIVNRSPSILGLQIIIEAVAALFKAVDLVEPVGLLPGHTESSTRALRPRALASSLAWSMSFTP